MGAVESICHRYGPGRLPGADRGAIGAGYAAASAALAATLLFAAGTYAAALAGITHLLAHPFLSAVGLVAAPFVVPAAFVAGALVWARFPRAVPYSGAVAGAVTTLLTYLLALAAAFVVLIVLVAAGEPAGASPVVDAAVLTFLIGAFAIALTVWFTLPLGVAGGYVYERVRERPRGDATH